MRRRLLLPLAAMVLLPVLAGLALGGCGTGLPERPNVVLIVVDSLRADALSGEGYRRETSPRLDAFARENLVFEDVATVAASTPPAMAALMSGRLPFYESGTLWTTRTSFGLHRFFASDAESGLPRGLDTLAEILRGEGYATAGFVTNGYLKRDFQFDQGFATFEEMLAPGEPGAEDVPYAPAEELTRRGVAWLAERESGPFLLFLHYMDVHYPYLPPAAHREALDFPRVEGHTDASLQERWLREEDLGAPELRGVAEHMRGLYDAEIRHTDHWIGFLLDHLRRAGLWDETLVVVTSDHGEEFLEHGGTLHKGKLYEELVRVPLLMRVPGRGPARISGPVRNFDVMPTILDYCKGSTPPDLDARSLRPLIEGRRERGAPEVVASFPVLPGQPARRMLRTGRFKLIEVPEAPERGELYDLREDRAESRNLLPARGELAGRLRARLDAAFAKPAREAHERGFDVSSLQRGAEAAHDESILEALERMPPEQQEALIREAQERRRPGLHEGIDPESAEQLRAIGYVE